jgi:hypothetical protein
VWRGRDVVVRAEKIMMRSSCEGIEGVHLRQLTPFTTLLVRTTNSLYRIVVTDGCRVYVQGGAFFPDPTSAYVEGASVGLGVLKLGCIAIGLAMEIQAGGRRVLTSPVRAITTERTAVAVVH